MQPNQMGMELVVQQLNQTEVNFDQGTPRNSDIQQQSVQSLEQERTLDQNLSSKNIFADQMSQLRVNEVQIKIEQAKRLWTMKCIPYTKKNWFKDFASEQEIYLLLMKIINVLLSFEVQRIKFAHLEHLSYLFSLYLREKQSDQKIDKLKLIFQRLEQYTRIYKLNIRKDQAIDSKQYSINSHKFLNALIQGLFFQNIDEVRCINISSMFDLYVNQPKEYHSDYYELKIIVYLNNNFSFFLDLPCKVDMEKLSSNQIELINAIYKSEFISDYVSLYQNIQPNQSIAKDIKVHFDKAFQQSCNSSLYYTQLQQEIFCCIDLNGNVLFSKIKTINQLLQLFMQIHSLVLSKLQQGLVIQTVNQDSFQYYSELFTLPLNNTWLTKNRIEYLRRPHNWLKNRKQIIQDLQELELTPPTKQQPSLIQILPYNPLLSILISRIKELFVIIGQMTLSRDQKQLIQRLKQNKQTSPILTKNYTKLEYYHVLLRLIEQALIDQELRDKISNISDIYPRTLTEHFDYFLCCINESKQMILESFYLWLFQQGRSSQLVAKAIECVIQTKIGLCKIQSDDIQLIKRIVWSQNAWFAIYKINTLHKESIEKIQSEEYDELLTFLSTVEVLEVDIPQLAGITLLNGRICLHRKYNPSIIFPRIRAMRIITLVHEAFGHKKRIDYVDQLNVLTPTPEKLKNECGDYLEIEIFGKTIQQVSLEQAHFILDHESWLKPSDEFISEFNKLPRHVDEVEKGEGNKENSLLKRQDGHDTSEDDLEGGCLFGQLRRNQ